MYTTEKADRINEMIDSRNRLNRSTTGLGQHDSQTGYQHPEAYAWLLAYPDNSKPGSPSQ